MILSRADADVVTDQGEKVMADGQITLTADSAELYERGRLVAHSSDDGGMPDLGLSVGLGDGWMLFVGDCFPNSIDSGWGIKLYGQTESVLIAEGIEGDQAEAAKEMIERIAGAICRKVTGED